MPNTHKILIVDDDPQLRDALTDQLALHEEFEAAAAENGTKGVQVAKQGQIDLVIMDVGAPSPPPTAPTEGIGLVRPPGAVACIVGLVRPISAVDRVVGDCAKVVP